MGRHLQRGVVLHWPVFCPIFFIGPFLPSPKRAISSRQRDDHVSELISLCLVCHSSKNVMFYTYFYMLKFIIVDLM